MSNIICPFCQQELRKIHPTYVICDNCRITGEDKLWQELIRTKKQLVTKCNQLEIAVDALKYIRRTNPISFHFEAIEKALREITALEQKDIK